MAQALHPMLNVAVKAARAAGAIINRASLDLDRVTVTAKSHNDFVTEVDQAAENIVIETLLGAYPGHGILAEESGRSHGAKDSDYLWIIDPLDGTTNFIHGFPVYNTSIALAFRGQVQQAVVYDPTRNDLFYASKGRGAFLNDKRLRVSKRTRLIECLIGTGFPFRKGDNFQRYLKMFEEVMQHCAGLRRPGAAALDLCYVAAGWYDGFFETGLSPWDIAAGSLMVTEAGGLIGNFTGDADYLYQREIVAGNPKIYAQLVSMLAPYTGIAKPVKHQPALAGALSLDSPALFDSPHLPDPTSAFVASAAAEAGEAPSPPKKPPVRIRKADAVKPETHKEVAPRRPTVRPVAPSPRAPDPSIALRAAFGEVDPPLPDLEPDLAPNTGPAAAPGGDSTPAEPARSDAANDDKAPF